MEYEDAELVSQSRAGNREAFERIVARYQALICSLAYSATGNVSRSEELAQETFLAAWQQLGSLREPQRLRSWLCGIARNLARNAFRSQAREPLHQAEPLETAPEPPSPDRLPSEQAVTHEEEAIVWRALEAIPDLYKEPLILFYREGCSVATVARQLDLSEDAVKQRLARGREMLRAETMAVVEGTLRRSRPGRAFTLGVMAALPAMVAGSASAAVAGVAGKTAVPAAKALLSAATTGAALGALGGLLGGAVGGWASWQTARYQRERALLRRSFIVYGVGLAVFTAPLVLMSVIGWRSVAGHQLAFGIALSAWILGFIILNLVWSLRLARQARRIRAEEVAAGTAPLPEAPIIRRASRWAATWEGRQWHSRRSLFGLPLIDINFSSPETESSVPKATVSALLPGRPRVARGWIALGDRAHGLLFACGNIAIGGIAIGGVSVGVLAVGGAAAGLVCIGGAAVGVLALGGLAVGAMAWGGAALGCWAFGGLALGWMAWGGGAFAWHAAAGGLACAHDVAVGGKAVAAHANDAVAREFVSQDWFFRAAEWQQAHVLPCLQGPWFVVGIVAFALLVPVLLFAVGYRRRRPAALGVLTALLLALQSAHAAGPKTETWTLTNGIRLVSVYFPQSTNAAIFTYVPMGFVRDGPRQTQWSHLVEHLVIRSTVSQDLATANAETLPDHMRLDFYGKAGNWQEGLSHHRRWLEGVPFTQASLEAEKPKVQAEGESTARNCFTHKFALAAWAQGYRHDQPHAAVRGDIDRASLNEIQAYRDNGLAIPSNVLVCVAGGIEPAKVLPVAAAQLGSIKLSGKPAPAVKPHPGNREMTWDLDARHLVLTWPAPGPEAADFPALLTVAQCLNMKFFSDAALKKMTGMTIAGVDLETPEGHFFYVSASLRPGSSFADVRKQIEQHVRALTAPGQELSLAPMLAKQQAESLINLPNPSSLAGQLPPNVTPAALEMNLGLQWGMNEFRYGTNKAAVAARLSQVRAEDVRQTASKYLSASKCSVITLQPR